MFPTRHASCGTVLAALTATVLLGAIATAPAGAAPAAPTHGRIVHQTPTLPIVIDGVRYAPEQIHRFDGRPLYIRSAPDGKSLIAYSHVKAFQRFLHRRGLRLPTPVDVSPTTARPARAGDYVKVCTEDWGQGYCKQIDSGFGVAAMAALDLCIPFTPCVHFNNNVTSVEAHGVGALLYDIVGFNFAGGSNYDSNPNDVYYVPANTMRSLVGTGFDNRTSSMYAFW
jgi:hypothetical protein